MAAQEALCWLGVWSALFFSGYSRSGNTLKNKSWVNQGFSSCSARDRFF